MTNSAQQITTQAESGDATALGDYTLKITPLVVDKLGVKLYDKASAVVSELIANSYDADAERVVVRLPLAKALATRTQDRIDEKGYEIEVIDDGHGMMPKEAQAYYLPVGRDRRVHPSDQGNFSREKRRRVMGRKGIGKLAPFGICRRIEVISAGGPKTDRGYLVAHFYMDYDEIMGTDIDSPQVPLKAGRLDRTYKPTRGTIVRLSKFLPKIVPDRDTFHRQLAARFVFADPTFEIWVQDTSEDGKEPEKVKSISVPTVGETKIDLNERPVRLPDGTELPVEGWLAMAQTSYDNEEFAGVRIYARNKFVASTRDFEQPAGFTGEFTVRSYLVGEVRAEWLDENEDLIRSDRQGILWESEYGRAMREWGGELIKEIGRLSTKPRRDSARDIFLKNSNFIERAKKRYESQEIVQAAVDLAGKIGELAHEDELESPEYLDQLSEVILSVAPHTALIDAFRQFASQVDAGEVTMESLIDLFGKARVAEMASYSQIAAQRVKSIRELRKIVRAADANESEFQKLLAKSPWLIDPTWTVITENQPLRSFKRAFEAYWYRQHGEELVIDIGYASKRPDFTLVSVRNLLHVVEIKKAGHVFDDQDCGRLINYVRAFRGFFKGHPGYLRNFPHWQILLVADGINLRAPANQDAYQYWEQNKEVTRITWEEFLLNAETAHELFLNVSEEAERRREVLDPHEES